jgi:hypothetical protein
MKKEVPLSKIEGKTVASACRSALSGQFVLTFTDGTFTALGIDNGYEAGDEKIVGADLDWDSFGDAMLVEAGIGTAEEIAAVAAERKARFQAIQDARDRQAFERLKQKFEPKEPSNG